MIPTDALILSLLTNAPQSASAIAARASMRVDATLAILHRYWWQCESIAIAEGFGYRLRVEAPVTAASYVRDYPEKNGI